VSQGVHDTDLATDIADGSLPEELLTGDAGVVVLVDGGWPVGDEADEEADGEREHADEEANKPLPPVEAIGLERNVAVLGNDELDDDCDHDNGQEDVVLVDVSEHVEVARHVATVDLVEDLHKHKRIEHDSAKGGALIRVGHVQAKQGSAIVEEEQVDKDLFFKK